LLRCLGCGASPLVSDDRGWSCPRCRRPVPIVRGVARFVGSEAYATSFGFQWSRFARTQLDSATGGTRSRDTLLQKTGWSLDDVRGKRVLDAGCGMGRFAEVCAEAGAEVHAVDLSAAIDAAAANLSRFSTVHLYQADIMQLPFASGSFDLIYSIGVLHHTPDTKAAFMKLVPLLKPGGAIAIWVYARRLRWLLGGEVLRRITPALPKPWLLRVARLAIPLYHVHRIPVLGRLTFVAVPTSLEADPDWRWLDTFDWYSPTFQWKHDAAEVAGWFEEAGLTAIRRLTPPVAVTGRRRAGA
jgi:SAM-dependent methyltransferase